MNKNMILPVPRVAKKAKNRLVKLTASLLVFVLVTMMSAIVVPHHAAYASFLEPNDINLTGIYTPEIYIPTSTVTNSAPNVVINSYTFITNDNRTVEVQYSFPDNPDRADMKIVIVMPGLTRDPDGAYMRSFSYLSKVENICVITPKFSEASFPTSEYQRVNIGPAIDYNDATFIKVDDIFKDFVKRFGLQNEKYILYGHSAGGQFAHRTAIFNSSEYIDYIIAASSGSYTFLDEGINYSSGIKNLLAYKSIILSNLCTQRVYILTGNKDNDPNADDFTPSEQGNTRYEKALNFSNSTLSYAIQNRVYYNWETLIMDGVDHSSSATIPYVLDIITGIYKSKTPEINERINRYYASAGIPIMSDWAKVEINEALNAGIVPDSIGKVGWTNATSRLSAAEAMVSVIENATGKTMAQIAAERGWDLSQNTFSDTNSKAVTFLKYAGITTGIGDNKYDPFAYYTRAQIVTMIGRTAEAFFGAKAQGTNPFTDVPAWAAPYVGYAADNGITTGVGSGLFDSNGLLQNQHTAIFCYRALKVWK